MSKEETKNAIIKDANLFIERGMLTSFVNLDYGGTGQGFGGYSLGGVYTDAWVKGVMKAVGVEDWDHLAGKTVRVKVKNGLVVSIGHIVNDVWFNPKEEFDKLKEAA